MNETFLMGKLESLATHSIPSFFHIASTFATTDGSIFSICGHARVNPSAAHFLVASIPIFDP